jgi:hypothetical protein
LTKPGTPLAKLLAVLATTLLFALSTTLSGAQQTQSAAREAKPAPTEKNPAQIELLETKVRFETSGDSRKEVHARVRINNELGARQFARLNFDFNRSFQSVEIPLVRLTHASGGTADILPSAISDNPNPAVMDFPAYHDVRVKSVRILGLQPDDLLEYRVITSTSHHPLAPDFWSDHTFDRSGVVSAEVFILEVPQFDQAIPKASSALPPATVERKGTEAAYTWKVQALKSGSRETADIVVTTFKDWDRLSERLNSILLPPAPGHDVPEGVFEQADRLVAGLHSSPERLQAIYNFVSRDIRTVDIPLGATGFRTRAPDQVWSSKYATSEDKYALFRALASRLSLNLYAAFTGPIAHFSEESPAPTLLTSLLILAEPSCPPGGDRRQSAEATNCSRALWLDPALEVAPFNLLPQSLRGKQALVIPRLSGHFGNNPNFVDTPEELPFPAKQQVTVRSRFDADGTLSAKVNYELRGDNELLLRVAFHKTEKEKWKDVAQMLALSDGFRGQIVNVAASDPYSTNEPFRVEYEISQPKFVDWSKKIVRIPPILPLPGLPDAPTAAQIEAKKPIEMGTPLSIDLEATIELPAGATAQAPIGTTVNRDYATFSSKYSAQGNILRASRSLHFLASELPASRATDFNAFLHAVQSDQTQLFSTRIESVNEK